MDASAIFLWSLAVALGFATWLRRGNIVWQALPTAAKSFLSLIPKLVMALLTAGFIGQLLPTGAVGTMIGEESGVTGVLIASVVGCFVPGGPVMTFPIIVLLANAGAGLPQLIAFLTAWSVVAAHRLLIYEITLMGWRFSTLRVVSSLILAPIAGLTALMLG